VPVEGNGAIGGPRGPSKVGGGGWSGESPFFVPSNVGRHLGWYDAGNTVREPCGGDGAIDDPEAGR
jgi:hypothetical protein